MMWFLLVRGFWSQREADNKQRNQGKCWGAQGFGEWERRMNSVVTREGREGQGWTGLASRGRPGRIRKQEAFQAQAGSG